MSGDSRLTSSGPADGAPAPVREPDLVDLAVAVTRRRTLAGIVGLATVAVVCLVAWRLGAEEVRIYRLSLQIGSQLVAGRSQPFESPVTVVTKLRDHIIPTVLERWRAGLTDDARLPSLSARANGESEVVTLEARGTVADGVELAALINASAQMLVDEHALIFIAIEGALRSTGGPPLNPSDAQAAPADPGTDRVTAPSGALLLANLRRTRVLEPGLQVLRTEGTDWGFTVTFGVVLGIAMALFIVLAVEFVGRVRARGRGTAGR